MSRRTAKRQSFYARKSERATFEQRWVAAYKKTCPGWPKRWISRDELRRLFPRDATIDWSGVETDLAIHGMSWRDGRGQRIDPRTVYIDALPPLWPPQVAIAVSAP